MKQILVEASKSYYVHIDSDLLTNTGNYISKVCTGKKSAIISDTNVFPSWGNVVRKSLEDAGFQVCSYVFPAGETSKNGQTFLEILDFLAKNQLTRSDVIIALGGGVVGDIAGFSAASYLRGISYVQIPTTLLAMVDSSVGGKTAIDLPSGKNLAGAFYQPKLVLCSLNTLSTLPDSIFCDGCAEVIKYGILYDAPLFHHLQDTGLNFDREYVISRCIELKRDVVKIDEFDNGARQMLNLGHTIGHAIEAESDYTVSHGQAVAIGTAMIAKAAAKNGICQDDVYQQIQIIIKKFSLPTNTSVSPQDLYEFALNDKKRTYHYVNLIVPKAIGECDVLKLTLDHLKSFIEAGK